MTDAEYQAWLVRDGYRVALIEVDTDIPRYLSTVAYTTLPTDTPANRMHLPCVAGGFAFSERLSLDGNPAISAGDIELSNEDGALDAWLSEVWVNRAIRVYIGDVSWSRADFRLEFSGVVADLTSSAAGRLNIVLRNKLERLNTPVVEAVLGGTTTNKDRLLPVLLGECHNVEPLLVDPANHEYQVHSGPMERVIEVRDNGVPLSNTTAALSTGKFRLGGTPAGTITVSAQGRTPYQNTAGNLVRTLATAYGTPSERLTPADLDTVSLDAFNVLNQQVLGMSLPDRANVLQCCQQIAASVGAQVVMSRQGLLRLVKVALPGVGAPVAIGPSDYEAGSLSIKQRIDVVAGVKLGYCRAWSVQANLDTGIPPAHKDLFAQEWLTVTARDTAVAAAYRLYAEPAQVDTLLLRAADAQAEADRRLALWKVSRTVYSLRGYAHLLTLELGQPVTLTAPRWGLDAGRQGIVIAVQRDWIAGRCVVEVLI